VKLPAQTGLLVCIHRQSRLEIEVPVEELGKLLEQIVQLAYKLRQRRLGIEVLV
jgi:hypothetical protein